MSNFFLLLFLPLFSITLSSDIFRAVTWDKIKSTYVVVDKVKVESGFPVVAWASFYNQINETGWGVLEVSTNESYPDVMQAQAAGMCEAVITADLINNQWMNTADGYCKNEKDYCQRLTKFLDINYAWLQKSINLLEDTSPYWHQVNLVLKHLEGLEMGYNQSGQAIPMLDPPYGLLSFHIEGDLEDLEGALHKKMKTNNKLRRPSCSALVKVLPGNKDLFFSHDAWSSYQSMLRIVKKYNFGFHTTDSEKSRGPIIPGRVMSFSSYPGSLLSKDDFYILSSGLAAMETTNSNNNQTLYDLYVRPDGTVLEWIRNLVANRLATTALEWTKYFKMFNSGTYNNQWMIVDYNKFKPGKPLPKKNLLYVLEQLPGIIAVDDVTPVLASQGYWASYNVPYFPIIFNASGQMDLYKKFGDMYSHDRCPRALIFKRDQGKVTDMASMIKLMRYNDYLNDPLSKCNCTPSQNAENAISARSDLNPKNGTYPASFLGHRSHGGIDMKVTNFEMAQKFEFIAICGPVFDNVPVFQWSKSDFQDDTPHQGHPDTFQFKPVHITWTTDSPKGNTNKV